MSFSLLRALRWIFLAAGGIAYAVLAHYSAATAAATTWPSLGVAVSLAPSLAILLWLSWRSQRRFAMLMLCAAVAALLWGFWGALERNFNWVYFLQHAGTNLMLAGVFGVTLARGRKPLCSQFAEAVHGGLTDEVAVYTRQVTQAWMLFFLAVSLVSGILFFLAGIEAWSVFANFLTFPLIVLMFGVEYRVRLRRLPTLEHRSILDGVRAYWQSAAASPDASSQAR